MEDNTAVARSWTVLEIINIITVTVARVEACNLQDRIYFPDELHPDVQRGF